MLTADAFGVLPPIARLTREQALFYFLSGYTAKVAGTEIGVTEPQATFSACFGAPFLPQSPSVYAELLGERLESHGSTVWLVNTGWTGGPYGQGERMPIAATRAMLHAALSGGSRAPHFARRDVFGFEVPEKVPGVDQSSSIRVPRGGIPRRTTSRRQSSRACSPTTSRASTTRCRRRSPPRGRVI